MSSTQTPTDPVLSYQPAAEADADPYVLTPDKIADPPVTLGRALRQVGPGLILAGAIVGTGELIATTNLGAKVGFALLWLVIVSCFIKVFVQVELGRYAISSGHTSMMAFRQLPGPGMVIGWWWVGMMLVTQLQLGAMVGGVGQALHMAVPSFSQHVAWNVGKLNAAWGTYLAGRPELPWAVLATLGTVIVLARGSYAVVEKGTTLMVAAFTLMTVGCVVLLPASGHPIPWAAVGQGLTFEIPAGAIAAALAMFGITGVGAAELVAYPYWCIEKGYASRTGARDGSESWLRRARGWMAVMRLDAWVSFAVYTLATLAFYFLGAAVLHQGDGAGLPQTIGSMLNRLAGMYAPVMGEAGSKWFIVIGVIAVLYSTLFAATGANSRALVDCLKVNGVIRFDRPGSRRRWVSLWCVIFPIVDLILFVWIGSPLTMVIIGGIAQALTLPMIGAAAVYLRYKRTDERLRPGKAWDVFLWLSLAGLTLTAGVGLWDQLKKVM